MSFVAGVAIGIALMLVFHCWDSMKQLEYWLSIQRKNWRIIDKLRHRLSVAQEHDETDEADWWKQN